MSASKYLVDGKDFPQRDLCEVDVDVEEWRPIPWTGGRYQASSHGRIRAMFYFKGGNRNDKKKMYDEPYVLRGKYDRYGYRRVQCFVNGDNKTCLVHVLVLEAFVGPRPNKREAGHRNGNPQDNRLCNLGWLTKEEQERDKQRHGRIPRGSKHNGSKLTELDVRCMKVLLRENASEDYLALRFGVTRSTVHSIANERSWKHVSV